MAIIDVVNLKLHTLLEECWPKTSSLAREMHDVVHAAPGNPRYLLIPGPDDLMGVVEFIEVRSDGAHQRAVWLANPV